jgi:hypothetical protein
MTRREERLAKEGWQRRGEAAEPRLSEMKRLYEEIGFEVRLEPFDEEERPDGPGCAACFHEDPAQFKVIYTRR